MRTLPAPKQFFPRAAIHPTTFASPFQTSSARPLPARSLSTLMRLTLILVLTGSALAQSGITLTVSATMDIWQAGGNVDGSDGVAPAMYSFPAASGQTLKFSSVAGSWACAGYFFGPDGTSLNCFGTGGGQGNDDNQIINPIGYLSGYASTDFVGAMVGVFLEDALPSSVPPSLRFYITDGSLGGIQTNFTTLSPVIGRPSVFYRRWFDRHRDGYRPVISGSVYGNASISWIRG